MAAWCRANDQEGTSQAAPAEPEPVLFVERGRRSEVPLGAGEGLPLEKLIPHEEQEYRNTLRAHFLRAQNLTTDQAAVELGLNEAHIRILWDRPLPQRPRTLLPFVAQYELRLLSAGVQPFRRVELRRRYLADTVGLFEECCEKLPWRPAIFRKRSRQTGQVYATTVTTDRQDCTHDGLSMGIGRLDAALVRLRRELQIRDPQAYLFSNWYKDGNTSIAAHCHDFWSAILSFGATRIFLLDDQPLLLGEGDLLVFGTQRHSVPKMPGVAEGRVSVAIFWHPEVQVDTDSDAEEAAGEADGRREPG